MSTTNSFKNYTKKVPMSTYGYAKKKFLWILNNQKKAFRVTYNNQKQKVKRYLNNIRYSMTYIKPIYKMTTSPPFT
ncbi:MAG: hypothetical protein WCK48_00335 [bacterium]